MKVEGFPKRLQQELFFQLISILKDIIIRLLPVRKPSIWSEGPSQAALAEGLVAGGRVIVLL